MKMSKKWLLAFNAILLALLPVFEGLVPLLPTLQLYLPDDIYRSMGLVVVLGNFFIGLLIPKESK